MLFEWFKIDEIIDPEISKLSGIEARGTPLEEQSILTW